MLPSVRSTVRLKTTQECERLQVCVVRQSVVLCSLGGTIEDKILLLER